MLGWNVGATTLAGRAAGRSQSGRKPKTERVVSWRIASSMRRPPKSNPGRTSEHPRIGCASAGRSNGGEGAETGGRLEQSLCGMEA